MILGVSGLAGTGKDTIADILVKNHGFVKVSLADPLKRILKDVYGFTDEQLWGPSEKRNKPDKRYPRNKHELVFSEANEPNCMTYSCKCCGSRFTGPNYLSDSGVHKELGQCYLTPRYALQLLGTEWGRHCYDNTWVDYALRVADALLSKDPIIRPIYTPQQGLNYTDCLAAGKQPGNGGWPKGIAIPDVRFKNEIAGIGHDGSLLRVKRPGYEKPRWDHPSETEQMEVPDEEFDYGIYNGTSLADLEDAVGTMVASWSTD